MLPDPLHGGIWVMERLIYDGAADERRNVRTAIFGRCLRRNPSLWHRYEYDPLSLLAPQCVPSEVMVIHTACPLLLIWLA